MGYTLSLRRSVSIKTERLYINHENAIHLFNQYLLTMYYMLVIVPGSTGNIAMNTAWFALTWCFETVKKHLALSWSLWEDFVKVMLLYILTEVEVCQGGDYQVAEIVWERGKIETAWKPRVLRKEWALSQTDLSMHLGDIWVTADNSVSLSAAFS